MQLRKYRWLTATFQLPRLGSRKDVRAYTATQSVFELNLASCSPIPVSRPLTYTIIACGRERIYQCFKTFAGECAGYFFQKSRKSWICVSINASLISISRRRDIFKVHSTPKCHDDHHPQYEPSSPPSSSPSQSSLKQPTTSTALSKQQSPPKRPTKQTSQSPPAQSVPPTSPKVVAISARMDSKFHNLAISSNPVLTIPLTAAAPPAPSANTPPTTKSAAAPPAAANAPARSQAATPTNRHLSTSRPRRTQPQLTTAAARSSSVRRLRQ